MKSRTLLVLLVALGVVATACDSDEAELSSTTSVVTGTTEALDPGTTTTTSGSDPASSTTLVGETVATHEVTERISTDNGEIVYIVIPPGAYTDVDLVNFIGDLKEADPDLWGAEVFDDPAGPEALVVPEGERTEGQQETLDEHHFVSLANGDRVIFQGPFSEFGEFVLGS